MANSLVFIRFAVLPRRRFGSYPNSDEIRRHLPGQRRLRHSEFRQIPEIRMRSQLGRWTTNGHSGILNLFKM